MAQSIEFTVRRDVREELRRKVENAPEKHAEAVLAAYELLQEAQDHGVLDTLRGAIGAGEAIIGKVSEYANTPEGIRLMRNLLAITRLLGEIDPEILDTAAKAFAEAQRQEEGKGSEPPSLWQMIQRLNSKGSRRTLAMLLGFTEGFGNAQDRAVNKSNQRSSSGSISAPVIAFGVAAIVASFWIGRNG